MLRGFDFKKKRDATMANVPPVVRADLVLMHFNISHDLMPIFSKSSFISVRPFLILTSSQVLKPFQSAFGFVK
jgi:hypothetical protein